MTADALAGDRRAGELLAALAKPEGRADPYPLYDRLRALGRAVVTPGGSLVVTGYRECSALLRDHRLRKKPERMLAAAGYPQWRDRPSLRLMFTSVVALDPPAHTRLRRLITAAFTARRVQGLRPAVERIAAQACEQVAGENDFVACFAFPMPVTVIGELLGIPAADRPMFQDLVRDWTAVLEVLTPAASAVVRRRDPLLSGRPARPAGGTDRVPRAAVPVPPPGPHWQAGLPGGAHPARPRQPASLRPLTCGPRRHGRSPHVATGRYPWTGSRRTCSFPERVIRFGTALSSSTGRGSGTRVTPICIPSRCPGSRACPAGG